MQLRSLTTTLLAVASVALAQEIKIPGADNWWVAGSTNVLEWDCRATGLPQQFTVLITNQDINKFPAPLAITAQQNNFECSVLITQDKVNQPAGTDYQILFANPLNNTDVYVRSELFEIKPLGSLYPSQAAEAAASSSAAAASATPGANGNADKGEGNGAVSTRVGAAVLFGAVGVLGGALALF